jgi:hypothetical protein
MRPPNDVIDLTSDDLEDSGENVSNNSMHLVYANATIYTCSAFPSNR